MKRILLAAFFLFPALLAAAPPPSRQYKEPPEVREQLKKDAAALEAQLKVTPADIEIYMRLGYTYSRLEQADDAQRAFEGAVRLDPKKAGAHYMLGLIYEKKGLRDRAIAAWKACLENTQDPHMRDTAERHIHHLSQQ
ncbi:MAG TPA: tetratricopeptide repeat protein [Elusimicrobiales bacterium]|nr:tetratricopeptide repeat protein [Elusimicrobiales bacterium]